MSLLICQYQNKEDEVIPLFFQSYYRDFFAALLALHFCEIQLCSQKIRRLLGKQISLRAASKLISVTTLEKPRK